MSSKGPMNWRRTKKYAKCRKCDNSWLINKSGKYQDLFQRYATKQTLFLNVIDCPVCEPPDNEEMVFNRELKAGLDSGLSKTQAIDKANGVIEQYQEHTSHYTELKLLPKRNGSSKKSTVESSRPTPVQVGAWGKPPPSIREKPTCIPAPEIKKSKRIISVQKNEEEDDGYCHRCCDCPVRANWGDMDECMCPCYC